MTIDELILIVSDPDHENCKDHTKTRLHLLPFHLILYFTYSSNGRHTVTLTIAFVSSKSTKKKCFLSLEYMP